MPNDLPAWDDTIPVEPTRDTTAEVHTGPSAGASQSGINFGLGNIPTASNQIAGSNPEQFAQGGRTGLALTAGVLGPEALMAAAPGIAPSAAASLAGYLARLGLISGVSGGSAELIPAAENVATGKRTVAQAAGDVGTQALIAAPVGVGLGVLGSKLASTVGGAVENGLSQYAGSWGGLASNVGKGALGGFLRPLVSSSGAAESEAARAAIKAATGVEVPKSMGEVLGTTTFGVPYAEIEAGLKNATGALSEQAQNEATRAVVYAASQLNPSGATKDAIGRLAVRAIEEEIGPISKSAKEAIDTLSGQLEGRLKQQYAAASGITAPSAEVSPYEAGELKKQLAQEGIETWKGKVQEAFTKVRQQIGKDAEIPDGLTAASQKAKEALDSGLFETKLNEAKGYDAYGNPVATTTESVEPIGKTVNDQVRGILDEITRAGNTPQKIQNVRGYISDLNDRINYGADAGRGDKMLKEIVNALKADVNRGIEALPASTAKEDLKAANSLFSGEGQKFGVDEILHRSVVNAAKEFGEGGTAAENLFKAVTGSPSVYKKYQTLLGDRFPALRSKLRDAILTDAQASAQPVEAGGPINIGSLVKSLRSIPKEIRQDLGLPVEDLRKLAADELKTSGLLKGIQGRKDDILDWMTANKADLETFADPQAFKMAVHAKAAEQELFNNQIVRDAAGAAAEKPAAFVDTIISRGLAAPDVEKAMSIIARHDPVTMQDIQVRMLEKLMEKSTYQGTARGELLSKLLTPPKAGAPSGPEGAFYDAANAVLGTRRTAELKSVAEDLAKLQKPAQRETLFAQLMGEGTDADFAWVAAKRSGIGVPMGLLRDVVSIPSIAKYKIAAKYLNTPSGRALLTKPVTQMTGAEAKQVVDSLTSP